MKTKVILAQLIIIKIHSHIVLMKNQQNFEVHLELKGQR